MNIIAAIIIKNTYTTMWVFERLPRTEWDNMRKAFDDHDAVAMIRLHDKYVLSPYDYCCGESAIRPWVEIGLREYWI